VAGLTATLIALGFVMAFWNQKREQVSLPLSIPVWFVLLVFLVLSATIMSWEVGEDNHAVLLTDIALVLGLLSVDRMYLLAVGTAAWLISSVLMSGQRAAPMKLVFNLGLRFFEYSLAIFAFDSFHTQANLLDPKAWLRIIASLALATSASAVCVTLVIYLATGSSSGELRRNLIASTIHTSMSTALAIPALILYQTSPPATLFIFGIGVLVVVPARQLNRLRRKYKTLGQIHEFTAGLSGSTDLDSTLARVLTETRFR
jgi:hypothetical protein